MCKHDVSAGGVVLIETTYLHNKLVGFGVMNGGSYTRGRFIYLKNPMGDVVGLADWQGNLVCTYEYDAWGKMLAVKDATGAVRTDLSFVGNMNPLRYRGYFWDVETGFYYCGSRYYDPGTGRWISADTVDILFDDRGDPIQFNLYAYCSNNPVNMIDRNGKSPANIVGGIIGAVAGVVIGELIANELGLKGWKRALFIAGCSVAGAAIGAFIGPYVAKLGSQVAAKLGVEAAKAIPKMGTQIGRLGKLTNNLKPLIKGLTNHGLQRMAERGVSQSLAQSIINSGYAIAQEGGKTLFFTKAGAVVLTKAGEVVTAYSAKYFDAAMQEIIKQFYGG
jgi:RHS repeat-associated protein